MGLTVGGVGGGAVFFLSARWVLQSLTAPGSTGVLKARIIVIGPNVVSLLLQIYP